MKDFIRKWNKKLEGFRGILAIWVPIGSFYIESTLFGLTAFTKEGLIMAAQISLIPTVKLIWTDAIPRLVEELNKWLDDKR